MDIIRRHTDYALRALLELTTSADQSISGKSLAKKHDIPTSFAYKILKKLVGAGILTSSRGRAGGFRLARKPDEITFRQVVDALQGPLSVSMCVNDRDFCERGTTCVLSRKLEELQNTLDTFIDHTTIEDILNCPVSDSDDRSDI